jgi:hypothetical protein
MSKMREAEMERKARARVWVMRVAVFVVFVQPERMRLNVSVGFEKRGSQVRHARLPLVFLFVANEDARGETS